MIYIVLAQSIINYVFAIWGYAFKSNFYPLNITLNNLLRIILNRPRLYSVYYLYSKL